MTYPNKRSKTARVTDIIGPKHKTPHDTALDNYEQSVGGRDKMLLILDASPDEDAKKLRNLMLADMENTRTGSLYSFRNLCRKVNLNILDVTRIHVQVLNSQAALAVMQVHAENMPGLVVDTYQDASSSSNACPKCLGEGRILHRKQEVDCFNCKGTGQIRTPGSNTDRRLLFEAAGLTKKQGPEFSQVNIDKAAFFSNGPPLESAVKSVGKLLKEES